jgi:hypothetical protein
VPFPFSFLIFFFDKLLSLFFSLHFLILSFDPLLVYIQPLLRFFVLNSCCPCISPPCFLLYFEKLFFLASVSTVPSVFFFFNFFPLFLVFRDTMGEGEDDFGELNSQLAALGLTLKQVKHPHQAY